RNSNGECVDIPQHDYEKYLEEQNAEHFSKNEANMDEEDFYDEEMEGIISKFEKYASCQEPPETTKIHQESISASDSESEQERNECLNEAENKSEHQLQIKLFDYRKVLGCREVAKGIK